MNATNILFDPIVKSKPVIPPDSGISREPESLSVEVRAICPRSIYMLAASDVMDTVVKNYVHPELIDVRNETDAPSGALHLTTIVSRFHEGNEEIWISCPRHMPPDLMRFRGRFGFRKICKMPRDHGSMESICWSFIDTNAGQINAFDLGLIVVSSKTPWYRVFNNKYEARSYYQS